MAVLNRIIREPAALIGLVTLVLAGGSIFGWWTLTQQQFEWVLAFLGAAILVLRQYVTPISDPNLPIGTIVNANSPQTTGVVVAKKPE
jgi:hypothetical protein